MFVGSLNAETPTALLPPARGQRDDPAPPTRNVRVQQESHQVSGSHQALCPLTGSGDSWASGVPRDDLHGEGAFSHIQPLHAQLRVGPWGYHLTYGSPGL